MAEWYYVQNGQRQGPVSIDELKQLAAGGTIGPDDLVWKDGMGNWVRAATVNELWFNGGGGGGGGGASAASQVPESYVPVAGTAPLGYYEPAGKGEINLTRHGMEMLRQTKPWVRFVSIMMFIGAGLMLVGGLIVTLTAAARSSRAVGAFMIGPALMYVALGALYIVPAMYLSRYASGIRDLLASPQDHHLNSALEAQKSFWKFVGMAMAIVLALYVLVACAGILMMALR